MCKEENIKKLRTILIRINEETTKCIPLSPLQVEKTLPVEELYSSVDIRGDPNYKRNSKAPKTRKWYEETKVVQLFRSIKTSIKKTGSKPPIPTAKKQFPSKIKNISDAKDDKNQSTLIQNVTQPADIFMTGGELTRDIYLLGDAARGKTTYCIWLLKEWCMGHSRKKKKDIWEKAMKVFDFVFLLQMRDVNPNRECVIDMLCYDIFERQNGCHATIRHVLSSENYKSLIIMDGLDEWNPNEETRKKLTRKGMPNLNVSSTVSCLFSMRPWFFLLHVVSNKIKSKDRVIEINGLSESGIEQVINNVLLHHYDANDDLDTNTKNITGYIKDNNLQSLMQIPLLAVVCVQERLYKCQIGDGITSFYTSMLNMLIERSLRNHNFDAQNMSFQANELQFFPEIVLSKTNLKNYTAILLKLGKVAFEGLLSNEAKLVFQKEKLRTEIGETELQFALDVGFISQTGADSLTTENVSVHFFHKSIQEFLAVMYIITNKDISDSFFEHLSHLNVIMEFSNVIIFMCGMHPSLGSELFQRVVSVTDNDIVICKYRESPSVSGTTQARELIKFQVNCYRELQCSQMDCQVRCCVPDILLYPNDKETVKVARKLLSDNNSEIKSLVLNNVSTHGEYGITNRELNDFLSKSSNTRSLVTLKISGEKNDKLFTMSTTDRVLSNISGPNLSYVFLHNVNIDHTSNLGENEKRGILSEVKSLRMLWLCDIDLGDVSLGLSDDMVSVEGIVLWSVKMAVVKWRQFVGAISNLPIGCEIELTNTNIDSESKENIRSSLAFSIQYDGMDKSDWNKLRFTRVTPPPSSYE